MPPEPIDPHGDTGTRKLKSEIIGTILKWALGVIATLAGIGFVSYLRLNYVTVDKFDDYQHAAEIRFCDRKISDLEAKAEADALSRISNQLDSLNRDVREVHDEQIKMREQIRKLP